MKYIVFNLCMVFAPIAFAQDNAANAGNPLMMNLVWFGALGLAFYFMLIRPQQKRAKAHQQLMSGLKKDDEIVTSGGIVGKILSIKDNFVRIEIAERASMVIQRQAISTVLPKGTLQTFHA